jgi:hypothetical protein
MRVCMYVYACFVCIVLGVHVHIRGLVCVAKIGVFMRFYRHILLNVGMGMYACTSAGLHLKHACIKRKLKYTGSRYMCASARVLDDIVHD